MDSPRLGLEGASLAVTSFVTSSHPTESCGLNGLPLTPHSISALGAGQLLLTCQHPNLAKYLDVQRGKHQRIMLVVEKWPDSLTSLTINDLTETVVMKLAKQILMATAYLNQMNIVNTNLSRENVMLTEEGEVKLFGYGLGRLTNYGALVDFPIGDPRMTAPEIFRQDRQAADSVSSLSMSESQNDVSITNIPAEPGLPYSTNVDCWSLGMLLTSLALDIPTLWPDTRQVTQVVRKVVSLAECESGAAVLDRVAREHGCVGRVATIAQPLLDLIHLCLSPPADRPTPQQLLTSSGLFDSSQAAGPVPESCYSYTPTRFPTSNLRCASLPWPPRLVPDLDNNKLELLSVREMYYLWELAGGDVKAELRKHGLMVTTPPVLSLPSLVTGEGQAIGQPKQRGALLDTTIINLPLAQLQSCVDNIDIETLTPLIDSQEDHYREMKTLPLVIRERDVKYQCSRVILYRKLLQGFPFRETKINSEALTDVVPKYRATIWAALLKVPHNCYKLYDAIDKECPSAVDRQIEVDIPRCHQYNELLASPEGHRKLKRVLKAWVADNPGLVYWQGLDSLAAPFLFLNFNDEALAWACLSSFIPKYLHNMFLKDNATVIQEYLAKFSQLQAFHDPQLFNHLDEIGFIPDLYSIPWFLTMFSHVFPLHKIFHLWDSLLLGNSSFPLCIGLAVLTQLRAQLMEAQFNECILLFSDMPAVDIDSVVSASQTLFMTTPSSLTWRQHECDRAEDPSPLEMSALPIHVLKTEKIGRVCGQEVLELLQGKPQSLTCLDIRPKEEFKLGTLAGSINIPATLAFNEAGSLTMGQTTLEEAKTHGKLVVVMGTAKDQNQTLSFAEKLLLFEVPRLVTLHGGVEVFYNSGALVVPNV